MVLNSKKPSYKELENKVRELEQTLDSLGSHKSIADSFEQDLINEAIDSVVFLDNNNIITKVNKTTERITGYSQQELIGMSVIKLIHPDYTKNITNLAEKIKKIDLTLIESKCIHKNGTSYWVEIHGRSTVWRNKKRLLAIIRTISERKKAEFELMEHKDFLKFLIDRLPGIFYVFDKNGVFLFWNRNLEQTSGYTQQEIKSKRFIDFFTDEDLTGVAEGIQEVFQKGSAKRELYFTDKNGRETPFLLTGSKILFQNTEYVVGVGIDLTERKKMEAQLRQSQKMEAIGQLVGGVAHDFNNMLNVIIGYTELLSSKLKHQNSVYNYLQEIKKAADYSADLTKKLLMFSRKQVITPKPLDINQLFTEMKKLICRSIGEDIEFLFFPGKEIWTVNFDHSQITQLIINLALNCRDAMPNGGKLTVETTNTVFNNAFCSEHPGFLPGQYVMIGISDSGTGINKETLPHIFEPFYTTKESGKGTGLGLSTVYGILKQNNGFINVYSEPEIGTTFKSYIPRWIGKEKPAEIPVKRRETSGTGTILLVEDNEMVRNLTKKMLDKLEYTVIAASSPDQAIEYCKNENTAIHILLTDVVMPKMNGKELKEAVEIIRPEIKTIFMSGYTSNTIVQRGVLDHGVNFIQKPFDITDLSEKLSEVLNK